MMGFNVPRQHTGYAGGRSRGLQISFEQLFKVCLMFVTKIFFILSPLKCGH